MVARVRRGAAVARVRRGAVVARVRFDLGRLDAIQDESNGARNDLRNFQFDAHRKFRASNLAVFAVAADFPAHHHVGILAVCRGVVPEHFHRIAFNGVEARAACLDFAFVLVCAAERELVATALPVGAEAFDRFHFFLFLLVAHDFSVGLRIVPRTKVN